MRKKIVAAVAAIVLVAALVSLTLRAMEAPLYTPGMVRAGENLRSPLQPPVQSGSPNYWQVEDDVRLAWTAHGNGRPVVVLHGGPGFPIRQPLPGLEPLANRFRFYYYDQRGCGKSTRPFDRFPSRNFYANMIELERTLGIGAQVADIERIRRILGEEKLVLMGHSFGAFLAAMYAAEFPDHVAALVLVAPAGVLVMPDQEGGIFEVIRHRLAAGDHAEYDRFIDDYLDFGSVFSKSETELAEMNRRLGEYFFAVAGSPDESLNAGQLTGVGGWMVQALYLSMGRRHDFRSALKQVHVPVLVIHGEADVVPERVSRMYAECFPKGELCVLENGADATGHFPFYDQPQAFGEIVDRFLARSGLGADSARAFRVKLGSGAGS